MSVDTARIAKLGDLVRNHDPVGRVINCHLLSALLESNSLFPLSLCSCAYKFIETARRCRSLRVFGLCLIILANAATIQLL